MAKLNQKRFKELRESTISDGNYMYISHLAEAIGVDHRLLTRMEYDNSYNPGIFTILKVSEFYNVTLNDLIIKE